LVVAALLVAMPGLGRAGDPPSQPSAPQKPQQQKPQQKKPPQRPQQKPEQRRPDDGGSRHDRGDDGAELVTGLVVGGILGALLNPDPAPPPPAPVTLPEPPLPGHPGFVPANPHFPPAPLPPERPVVQPVVPPPALPVPPTPPAPLPTGLRSVWITNPNGSKTEVVLRAADGGNWIGPKGEFYNGMPTEAQLRPVYGLKIAGADEPPPAVELVPDQPQTIWITNPNGSRTPVEIKPIGGGNWQGPKGETYNTLPTEEQLRPVYGL
jgi:hypothetical protein